MRSGKGVDRVSNRPISESTRLASVFVLFGIGIVALLFWPAGQEEAESIADTSSPPAVTPISIPASAPAPAPPPAAVSQIREEVVAIEQPAIVETPPRPAPPQKPTPKLSPANPEDFVSVVNRAKASVVKIETRTRTGVATGSGFVVHSDGIIATNDHVIRGAVSGRVLFSDETEAKILGYLVSDPRVDMALIKIEESSTIPEPLKLAVACPRQGSDIFTFGNPSGLSFVVSRGIVSAITTTENLERDLHRPFTSIYEADAKWVQIDAPISPGNSGGPLLNMQGEVVGVNTMYLKAGQNLNFAGSAETLRELIDQAPTSISPFRNLPEIKQAELVATKPEERVLSLPSGRVLDPKIFLPSKSLAAPPGARVATISYPSGKAFAKLCRIGNKLHGPAVALHESGKLMLHTTYVDGKRSGNLVVFDELGRLQYAAQFLQNNKEGFFCYCKEGRLWLVQECDNDKVVNNYIIDDTGIKSFSADETDDELLAVALSELSAFEEQVKANEVSVRRWVRELDEEERWARAAGNSAVARNRIQSRINDRAASRASAINGFNSGQ